MALAQKIGHWDGGGGVILTTDGIRALVVHTSARKELRFGKDLS